MQTALNLSMGKNRKTCALFLMLIIIILSLTFIVILANAQTIPKPSVPEFTLQTQTQTNTTIITLTIRNQPFDAASKYPEGFFYNVAVSIDEKNWSELYHVEDAQDWYPQQSNSSTTVLTYIPGETVYYPMDASQGVGVIPKSGEVAFQVQAMIGHRDRGTFINGFMPYVFVGETSDWSNAQTITIPSNSSEPTPTVPEFSWLIILPLLFCISIALVIIRRRVSRNLDNYGNVWYLSSYFKI